MKRSPTLWARSIIATAAATCAAIGLLWVFPPSGGSPDDPGNAPALLTDNDPLRRVLACEGLARGQDPRAAASLIPRASDSDWRVRSAAFAALDRQHPLGRPIPPRDMPMGEREKIILRWIAGQPGLHGRLCELYADPRHVELSDTMVRECLQCHAPDPPAVATSADTASCAQCHAEVHDEYTASSHAQSLSHLILATVNPRTRRVERYDFAPRRGIDCSACHAQAAPAPPAAGDARCAFTFEKPADSSSCLACHAEVKEEWDAWLSTPQFLRADWPPGQLTTARKPLTLTCTGCHMGVDDDGHGSPAHRLTARRDGDLLRSGLDLQLQPPVTRDGRRVVPVVLTNLAGHGNPTGTRRRALCITVQFEPGDDEPILIATLSPLTLPGLDESPALRPNEQRTFDVPLPPGARLITCTVIYVRHRFEPEYPIYEVLTKSLTIPR